jgi:hypothetical protein
MIKLEWIWNTERTAAETSLAISRGGKVYSATAKIWQVEMPGESARWNYSAAAPGLGCGERDDNTYSADSAMDYCARFLRAAHFQALARDIVKELGPSWEREKDENPAPQTSVRLVDYSGRVKLYVSLVTYGKDAGKLSISAAHTAPDAHKHTPYDEKFPSIHVSASKTPAQIVADMRRRVFPDTSRLIAAIDERMSANTAHIDLTTATTERVGKTIGAPMRPLSRFRKEDGRTREVDVYHSRDLRGMLGTVAVSGESVTFERFEVNADEAIAMLAALVKARNGGK